MEDSKTARAPKKSSLARPRNIVFLVLAFIGIYYALPQIGSLKDAWTVVRHSNWGWILASLALSGITFPAATFTQFIAGGNLRIASELGLRQLAGAFLSHFVPFSLGTIGLTSVIYLLIGSVAFLLLGLSSMGVHLPQAAAAILIYRLLSFWIPMIPGGNALRVINKKSDERNHPPVSRLRAVWWREIISSIRIPPLLVITFCDTSFSISVVNSTYGNPSSNASGLSSARCSFSAETSRKSFGDHPLLRATL